MGQIQASNKLEVSLTRRQRDYINLLSEVFKMKNSRGQSFPYRPQPYQIRYHSDCMLANPDSPGRIWRKSRGVGATSTTMVDALMVAHRYDGVKIPVTSVTGTQSGGPIEWAIWLADNTQIPNFFERDKKINSELRLDNGSVIFPIPGHNPDALRNYRTVFNVYDEFGFQPYQEKVKKAGDACLSEGGQINVLSTMNGTTNEFFRLIQNADLLGYKLYDVPIFDPKVFDVKKTIPSQIQVGLIKPISPWVDLTLLEKTRLESPHVFMEEYMCVPVDEGKSFLPFALIDAASRPPELLEQYARVGTNPYYMGIDFASEQDLSVFEIWERHVLGWIHRFRQVVEKSDTVAQNELARDLDYRFNFAKITIDLTGPGLGFYHYAKKDFGNRTVGIHFAQRWDIDDEEAYLYSKKDKTSKKDTSGQKDILRVPIKRAMAVNMKKAALDGGLLWLAYPELRLDLNSVTEDTLNAARSKGGQHGDEFWGSALAIHGADPYYSTMANIFIAPRRYR